MKTERHILLVAGAVLLVFAGLVTLAVILLGGVLGSLVVLAAVAAAVAAYLGLHGDGGRDDGSENRRGGAEFLGDRIPNLVCEEAEAEGLKRGDRALDQR